MGNELKPVSQASLPRTIIDRCMAYRTLLAWADRSSGELPQDDCYLLSDLEQLLRERPTTGAGRTYRRLPVCAAASFRGAGGELTEGVLLNLSAGGLFIATDQPLAVSARTAVQLYDEGTGKVWKIDAQVTWVDASGMGLRFLTPPVDLRAQLG